MPSSQRHLWENHVKTLNRQLKDALRPVRKELREIPKRVRVAQTREAEADEWIGFIGRNTDITPLRLKK